MMPNFLIIGAAKAGTTSVYYYLNQHPQIYMSSVKEPRFFAPEFYTTYCNGLLRDNARKSVFTLTEYQKLFERVTDEIAIGEASPEYIYFPKTPERIKQDIPNVKLIAILRNPIERAFSAFSYQVRDGCEVLSFEQALQIEKQRIKSNWRPGWHYKECGFYYIQLKRYFDIFPSEQIKVYLYEDLKADSLCFIQDVYRFLGVDDSFIPNFPHQNRSYIPKNKWLNYLLVRNNPLKSIFKFLLPKQVTHNLASRIKSFNVDLEKELTAKTRQELIELYREDISKLETLIQIDLSSWIDISIDKPPLSERAKPFESFNK